MAALRLAGAAIAAAVAGVVLTGAGLGIGIRYLQKTGLSLGTAAGVVSLLVGLSLLGYAARLLWGKLRRWTRLALVPLALVVIALLLPVAEGVAFSLVPPTHLGSSTPTDVGLAYRDVSFRTSDGVTLSAWYVRSSNHAAIVLQHGAGSTRTSTLPQAAVLAQAGYGVLMLDARGHGRSGGTANDRGWFGERDLTAAVTFLTHQPDVSASRIGLVGLSMGGEEAIGAAGADPRVRAVVAEGVTSRVAADKARWLPHSVTGYLQRGLDRITDLVQTVLSPAPKPPPLHESISTSAARFLLITAGKQPDEARAAAELRAVAPVRVSTWNVDGATHTHGLSTDPQGWRAHVIQFLDAGLAPTTG